MLETLKWVHQQYTVVRQQIQDRLQMLMDPGRRLVLNCQCLCQCQTASCTRWHINLCHSCPLQDLEGVASTAKRKRKVEVANPHKIYALQDVQVAAGKLYGDATGAQCHDVA